MIKSVVYVTGNCLECIQSTMSENSSISGKLPPTIKIYLTTVPEDTNNKIKK